MRKSDIFFLFVVSFIAGTVAGGLGISPVFAVVFALVVFLSLFFILKNKFSISVSKSVIVIGALLFILGNFYYGVFDWQYHLKKDSLVGKTAIEGIVIDQPRHLEDKQTLKIKTILNNYSIRLLISLPIQPEFSYGDKISLEGKIDLPPSNSYGNYLAKERIHGTMFFPEAELLGNEGNIFWKTLYETREKIKLSLNNLFNRPQANFLTGILLGDRDQFSKSDLEKFSNAGITHLTALSGDHMVIIVFIAAIVFSAIFGSRKRLVFGSTFFTISLFVAMTGFQVSAIRAAIMASLVSLADISRRNYSPRNAIALAALAITIFNPKIPVFDLGFQLSFLATLSIIYLVPVLRHFKFFQKSGFLGWRDILLITLSAQIGVLPIIMMAFENFSLTSFPANILIIIVVPILMVLTFLTLFVYAFFSPLAFILAPIVGFLTSYILFIIDIFNYIRIPFNPKISIPFAIIYYLVLIYIFVRYNSMHEPGENKSL